MAHLKVHSIKASAGVGHKADWSADVREFKYIKIEATGRGWAATHKLVFLETAPEQVEVDVLYVDREQQWAMVALNSNANDLTAKLSARPYKRVDGTSGPQIDLDDPHQLRNKPLRNQYGVAGFAFYDSGNETLQAGKAEAQENLWKSSKEWFESKGITFEQFCRDRVIVKLKELVQ